MQRMRTPASELWLAESEKRNFDAIGQRLGADLSLFFWTPILAGDLWEIIQVLNHHANKTKLEETFEFWRDSMYAKNNKIQKTSNEPGKENYNSWNAVGYNEILNFTLPPEKFCRERPERVATLWLVNRRVETNQFFIQLTCLLKSKQFKDGNRIHIVHNFHLNVTDPRPGESCNIVWRWLQHVTNTIFQC